MLRLPTGYKKLLDEYGELEATFAKLDRSWKRREQIRKQILEWTENVRPKQGVDLQGSEFCVAVSPRRPERVILSMAKAFAAMGVKKFLEVCGLSIKALEENVSADAFAKLVEERPIGRRTVTATRRLRKAA